MAIIYEHDFPLLPSQATKRRLTEESKGSARSNRSPTLVPAAILTYLPDELILGILYYLPGIDAHNFHLHSLLSLSLTCRRLNRIIVEKLYATYDSHFCEPYTFLRTMISNPRVAEFVQHANVIYGMQAYRKTSYIPTARDKKIIKDGMRMVAVPGWKELATACNEYSSDQEGLHNAMLLHIPNITSLNIECSARFRGPRSAWVDLISKASAGTLSRRTHRFENLRSIKVDVRSITLSQIAPLFRLQSLRLLHLREIIQYGMERCRACHGCHGNEGRNASKLQRLIPQACNNLYELILEHTFYDMEFLDVLLASPRQLSSFKYDVSLEHLSGIYMMPESTLLSGIICHQKTSLETLDVFCDARAEEETHGEIHLHGSLKGFTSLKRLSCPLSMTAFGPSDNFVERLPSSLVAFRTMIRRDTDDHRCLDTLGHMAANYRIHIPRLKEVRVVTPKTAPWTTYDWEGLLNPMMEAGVSFVVENDDDDEDEDDDFGSWKDDTTESSRSSDEVDLYSDNDQESIP
ncbi:hypothetical protein BDW02DRAFT_209632 [Decorospora gaudefroyi]|uniref:F-box domain-containing protein n=1 Tax=Decorospora gaudefroyi TaxID=184978 RepID=A0A6A5JXF5_9PLEO|nr:hypothetical protein BDW02DRAFT_209632 [Decorospora gaudefroyi]